MWGSNKAWFKKMGFKWCRVKKIPWFKKSTRNGAGVSTFPEVQTNEKFDDVRWGGLSPGAIARECLIAAIPILWGRFKPRGGDGCKTTSAVEKEKKKRHRSFSYSKPYSFLKTKSKNCSTNIIITITKIISGDTVEFLTFGFALLIII